MMEYIEAGQESKRAADKLAKRADAALAKARTKDSTRALAKLVEVVDGELRISADPPLIVPLEQLEPVGRTREQQEEWMRDVLASYQSTLQQKNHPMREFSYVHMARKVVGVGSVGTRAWIVLLRGRDDADPLLLQAKQAEASVLERFLPPSEYDNHGERVVRGQRLMQAASDIFLGWHRRAGRGRGRAGLLHPSTARLEGLSRRRHDEASRRPSSMRGCAARRSLGRTRVRATASPSPPTWGTATVSTVRSPRSRGTTATRTSATTRPSPMRWRRDDSKRPTPCRGAHGGGTRMARTTARNGEQAAR